MTAEPADEQNPAAYTLGSILRNARHAGNHSIEDVADATCIHIRIIQGMEDDDFSRMPAEVFVRGFIKLYSEFLGIDPDKSVSLYIEQENAPRVTQVEKPNLQLVLSDEKTYASHPVDKQNHRKIPLIATGFALGLILVISVGLFSDRSKKSFPITKSISGQENNIASNESSQENSSSENPEFIVNRPPAITIDKEVVIGHKSPAENDNTSERDSRIPEHKRNKVVTNKDNTALLAQKASRETELPSPELLIKKYHLKDSGRATSKDLAESAALETSGAMPLITENELQAGSPTGKVPHITNPGENP